MDSEKLSSIGESLANIAGVFAERRRQGHPAHGGATSFPFFDECLVEEARRLRGWGREQLADAVDALRSEIEGMGQ